MEYDPFSPEFQTDPFPVYRWMLEAAPVFHSEKWGWWALSRWDDVRAAALDTKTFLSFEGIDIDDTAKDQSGPGFLPDIDNPRHDQIRKIVQPHFLPRRIATHEENIRRVVRQLTKDWPGRGEVDVARELSWPLPFEVFFDLIGLPAAREEGREQLERWVHELKDRDPGSARLTPVAKAATEGIRSYFIRLIEERRRHPRQDVVSHIAQAEIDGVPFTDEDITAASEVMGLMTVLFLGGVETTSGLTSTFFKLLADNPDQRELLRRDPSLIPDAVEETVRYISPLQLVGRTTSREVTLHGVTIPEGGRVVLVYGAANHDPRQFRAPDRFDVTRGRLRHLGFGEGIHGCLGRPLALLEVKVAAEEVLPILGDYALSRPPVRYRSTPNSYVWEHLYVSQSAPSPRSPARPGRRTTTVTVAAREFEADVRVEAKDVAADGVVTLGLREMDGHPLPRWDPGAHVDLILEHAPTRQYSLCGDPADHRVWRLGILRDPAGRGSSLYVHDRLRVGDTARVRGPRNNFPLVGSPRYLFIAGGIGITPILPMIAAAEAAGAGWELVYGGRRRASMAFLDELARYGDRVSVRPQDESGLLDLESILGVPRRDTLIYCCGPEPLLAAVEERTATWPSRSLQVERFAAKPVAEPVLAESFEVLLARSQLTLTVPPERSILEVVEGASVSVLSSCREGTCGTCEAAVLQGEPDHRDSVLTAEERAAGDCMMICVSRSRKPRLVLDL
jgi:cytochrome P450/ferredoxin-NADP reductase